MKKKTGLGPKIIIVILMVYLFLPFAVTFLYSIAEKWSITVLPETYTLKFYVDMFTDPRFWAAIGRSIFISAAGVGLGTAGGNALAIVVLEHLPAVVAFPVRQGVLVLMMWAAGRLIYHDKPGKWDALILISGLAGIVLMNL